MEFDLTTTAIAFLIIIAVGVGGLLVSGVMPTSTVLMMVLPSMIVFGVLCLGLGVKHGEQRTA